MRKLSEKLGTSGAARAAQIVATEGIPAAIPRRNLLQPIATPIDILIRGGGRALAPH
jgi:hypothetical protein